MGSEAVAAPAAAAGGVVLDPVADADLIGRLHNYKFVQAAALLRADHHEDVQALVRALAAMFGNPGWFDGHMAVIVDAAMLGILPGGGGQ